MQILMGGYLPMPLFSVARRYYLQCVERIPLVPSHSLPIGYAPFLSAFSKPRKMVRNRWADCAKAQVESALRTVGCSEQARPEEIAYEEWIALFQELEGTGMDFEKSAFRVSNRQKAN